MLSVWHHFLFLPKMNSITEMSRILCATDIRKCLASFWLVGTKLWTEVVCLNCLQTFCWLEKILLTWGKIGLWNQVTFWYRNTLVKGLGWSFLKFCFLLSGQMVSESLLWYAFWEYLGQCFQIWTLRAYYILVWYALWEYLGHYFPNWIS